jgi:hypothetical protein
MQNTVVSPQSRVIDSATYVNNIDASQFQDVTFTALSNTSLSPIGIKQSSVLDKSQVVESIVAAADSLKSAHEAYEGEFVEGGRKALYSLLTRIYSLAIQINSSGHVESILKEMRQRLAQRKVRVQKNSSALTILVKWVVGVNRQTAHNYSKALQAALDNDVSDQGLCEFIAQRGGLQGAKASGVKRSKATKLEISKEFELYIRNADIHHKMYENTSINWTEKILGDRGSLMTMILGHSDGSGQIRGLRAFYLSSNAYRRIRAIVADDLFSGHPLDAVSALVRKEHEFQKAVVAKRQLNQSA